MTNTLNQGDEILVNKPSDPAWHDAWGIVQSGDDESGYMVGFGDILAPDEFPVHVLPFALSELTKLEDPEPTVCPKCNSTNWRCYDERSIDFYDPKDESGEVYSLPIGFMVCNDCDREFRAGVPDDLELVDDRDLR